MACVEKMATPRKFRSTVTRTLQPSLCRESSGFLSIRSDQKDTIITGNDVLVVVGKITMRTRSAAVVVVKIPARPNLDSAISEAQFDRLLDAVSTALGDPPKAINDNHLAWPLAPFPEGWHAAH
ncbi:MAG TPA: hypothetical protein VHQ48_04300 [Bradyrhizobium sp.]|nr:hypothetical protein [Bradyrhizobium sp.]